jgi:topoisomerase (DNA) II binding protein 1
VTGWRGLLQASNKMPRDRVTELPFQGLRVFLPRNYVPPEKFPALHDLLTNNGAEVCPILNASCNSNVDFHVMADNQTAKIKELLSKGCKVVGPECITRCARECRRLPDREYTCCFAMEGVGVLATGFSAEEKELIEWLVSSMCGNLQHQTSLNLDYVIAKNVLATKYKWAWSVLRKPIVSHEWLKHCAAQHRLVPYDPFRLPALAGLKICATGIAFGAGREEIQMGARENGATYSADLTMDCTHLIAQIPEGAKYRAATDWGLKVVSQSWFWQSLEAKVCLDEDYFPVRTKDLPVAAGVKKFRQEVLEFQENQEQAAPASPTSDNEVSASLGHKPEAPVDRECGRTTIPGMPDYLYLSGCQFYFTGFEAVEMRRLVNLVLDGGGTRYIEFNNAVTHVIVGQPLERELIMLRQLAMWDAVYILQRSWLEECSQQKMEVTISDRHRVPQNMLLPGASSDFHILTIMQC